MNLNPKDILKNIPKFNLVPKGNFFIDFTSTIAMLINNITEYKNVYTKDTNSDILLSQLITLQSTITNVMFEVKAMDIPDIGVSVEEVDIGSTKIWRRTGIQFSTDLQIEFFSTTMNWVRKLFYCWLQCQFDLATNTSKPRLYSEADIDVYIYDRTRLFVVEHRTYKGCFPISVERQRFDTMEYDYQMGIPIIFKINNGMDIEGVTIAAAIPVTGI